MYLLCFAIVTRGKFQVSLRYECAGIDKNRVEAGIIIGFPVKQEDTGLGGYGDLDLFGHLQPSATLKTLFGKENKDMPLDLFFVRPG